MALLPVAEILLRALFRVGISGAASFTQHFALVAGMLGAAVAAREQRLLSLSTLDSLLDGRSAPLARFFTRTDRKSTRLNSSHLVISYAVFCLKKKNNTDIL